MGSWVTWCDFFRKIRLKKFQALWFKIGGFRVLIGRLAFHVLLMCRLDDLIFRGFANIPSTLIFHITFLLHLFNLILPHFCHTKNPQSLFSTWWRHTRSWFSPKNYLYTKNPYIFLIVGNNFIITVRMTYISL